MQMTAVFSAATLTSAVGMVENLVIVEVFILLTSLGEQAPFCSRMFGHTLYKLSALFQSSPRLHEPLLYM